MMADPMLAAACRRVDPEIFSEPLRWDEARDICAGCPVVPECRAIADDAERGLGRNGTGEFWAGETPIERHRRRRREMSAWVASRSTPAGREDFLRELHDDTAEPPLIAKAVLEIMGRLADHVPPAAPISAPFEDALIGVDRERL